MEQSPLRKSGSRLAGLEIHDIYEIQNDVFMNSSPHPILSNLIQAKLSQGNESGTSVKPVRLNKMRFHEFYTIGYIV
jgi:hypothetical protein